MFGLTGETKAERPREGDSSLSFNKCMAYPSCAAFNIFSKTSAILKRKCKAFAVNILSTVKFSSGGYLTKTAVELRNFGVYIDFFNHIDLS